MDPPTHPTLKQIHHLDASSPNFHDQLVNALHGQRYRGCMSNIEDGDLRWLVNYLDKTLDRLDPPSLAFRECLHELRSICGTKTILPTSYTLSSDLTNIGPNPVASGGSGDVYLGTLGSSKVCVKRMRLHPHRSGDERRHTAIFYREAVMWKYWKHPNILPLLGVTIAPLQLISNWMPGETLPRYIKKHPDTDRLGLLSDVAKGLGYLHSCNVIHGGIKGANILVDDSSHVCIADFGHAMVIKDEGSVGSNLDELGITVRWTAPEVLDGGVFSKEADIFSFAMVMVEVFTDAVPFASGRDITAMVAITRGRRPPRPKHSAVTGGLWTLMQRCWNQDPKLRPEAANVLQDLLACNPPAWKKLIGHTLPTDERISLITSIFSDHDEVGVLEYLSSGDARAFIDMVDKVSIPTL
ncbi:kinase-like protein [Thelephora ganbajun]|uniref:Kinase-like protein n=1 Tax=Thelephora ganbajun TaxID=370292 RepID=A0ACB6ZB71_THEGA|nr:kinase-like protein [Thelephora ganbajun]